MIKKYLVLIIVLVMMAALMGCHLDIKNDVEYPADLFKQTLQKIDTLQVKGPGMKGGAKNLNFLVYDGDDRELITLSLPITAAKETAKWAINMDNHDKDNQLKGEKLEKLTQKLGDIKLDKLDILDRMGPGLLAEIEVNEPKDRTHVLIWLD